MYTSNEKKGIATLIREELQLLFFDKWLLFATTLLPAGLFAFMFCLFQQGIVRELPVAVVDMDQSRLSRMLTRQYDASSHLRVVCYPDREKATAAMRRGEVYGLVLLPYEMEKKIRLRQSPKITAWYNFQFILVGKALKSAMMMAHATFNAQVETITGLAQGNIKLVQAQGAAVVTRKQITPLYNLGLNYNQFLVEGLIPTIWQILIVATTILVWAAEMRRSGLNNWFSLQPAAKFLIRLALYSSIFFLQGIAFLAAFIGYGWMTTVGILLLTATMGITILAYFAIGTLLFVVIEDAARALSVAASYVAPCFAFLGVTFPEKSMNAFAQLWHSILPISYYMKVQIGVINHGASFAELLPVIQKLCCFLLIFFLVAITIRKKWTVVKGDLFYGEKCEGGEQ